MPTALTVAAALRTATRRLETSDSARLDAELLLALALAVSRTQLFADPDRALDEREYRRFDALVTARAAAMPVAYLTGAAEFWSLPLAVTPDVLIPRADTELVVATALALWPAAAPATVLDLGTGSGAIAAAMAHARPQFTVVASDRSRAALAVAGANFARLGLARVACFCGDWLAPVATAGCDVIVANPPYVGRGEAIDRAVSYEPAAAVFAAADGLADLGAIVAAAPRCLRRPGLVVVEHGHAQGAAVRGLLLSAGFDAIATRRDLAGHERVSSGWWGEPLAAHN